MFKDVWGDPNLVISSYSVNYASDDLTDEEIENLLGPFESTEILKRFPAHWTMAHIFADAGIFKSVTQARKNGCDVPIPDGFSCYEAGKPKKQIFVLKKIP